MKIHHLRNATFIIEAGEHRILIDPMLSKEGELPPFSKKRHPPKRNPTVPLPENSLEILKTINHCLITHSQTFGLKALQHTDHLDAAGEAYLRENNIPVVCREKDLSYLRKYGLRVDLGLETWKAVPFLGGQICAIPAKHGHGWVNKLMANGVGYLIELPDEPSVYISGDTVFTEDVKKVLGEMQPDIAVVASGSAQLDVGGPILMPISEILEFVRSAPKKVFANHLEALNHCSTSRATLKKELDRFGLLPKVWIPEDGEMLEFT